MGLTRRFQRIVISFGIEAPDAELDTTNGWCLCGAHHSLKTAREREKRLLKG
jgi:hypothetical protein